MKLSILICTLPEPFREPNDLFKKLTYQAANKSVQILYLGDNKSMSVGEKRNHLMDTCKGDRIIFVDDDDYVSDNYIEKLLEYCELNFDCVSIGVRMTHNNEMERIYDYTFKQNINKRENGQRVAGRMPNHLCLWRKKIALRCRFPDKSLGEDHEWANAQIIKGYSFFDTKEILYHYDFNREKTQTRL